MAVSHVRESTPTSRPFGRRRRVNPEPWPLAKRALQTVHHTSPSVPSSSSGVTSCACTAQARDRAEGRGGRRGQTGWGWSEGHGCARGGSPMTPRHAAVRAAAAASRKFASASAATASATAAGATHNVSSPRCGRRTTSSREPSASSATMRRCRSAKCPGLVFREQPGLEQPCPGWT